MGGRGREGDDKYSMATVTFETLASHCTHYCHYIHVRVHLKVLGDLVTDRQLLDV